MLLDVRCEAWKFPRKSRKSTLKIPINKPSEVNLGQLRAQRKRRVRKTSRTNLRPPQLTVKHQIGTTTPRPPTDWVRTFSHQQLSLTFSNFLLLSHAFSYFLILVHTFSDLI